jgi:hypothetical protein
VLLLKSTQQFTRSSINQVKYVGELHWIYQGRYALIQILFTKASEGWDMTGLRSDRTDLTGLVRQGWDLTGLVRQGWSDRAGS